MIGDRGSVNKLWICFGGDSDTGACLTSGKLVWVADGLVVEVFEDWIDIIQRKGHIDLLTKWGIIAAASGGTSALGAIARRFGMGG